MRKSIKFKNLITLFTVTLFAFSCATKNPEEENNEIVLPIIDQEEFEESVFQVRNSGQYKKFVTVDTSITPTNIQKGFAYYKGLDRITALRDYIMKTKPQTLENNKIAFIGRQLVGGIPAGVEAVSCLGTFNTNCTTAYTATGSAGGRPNSSASLGLVGNPFFPNSTTNYSPMGFGFPGNITFYMTEDTTGGSTYFFSPQAIVRAINAARNSTGSDGIKSKMIIFDGYESLRIYGRGSKNYASNTYLDGTSAILNGTSGLTDYAFVYNIANAFSNYLANTDNIIVLATGTMGKFNQNANFTPNITGSGLIGGSSNGILTGVNTDYTQQVAYGYYNKGHNGVQASNGFLPITSQSFLNGNIIQYIEANANGSSSKNNIALAVAVNSVGGGTAGVDYTYKPYAETVLPGSLSDYAFSVMIKNEFGNANGNGSNLALSGESKAQLSNAILASNINTLGAMLESNKDAISLIKTNFSLTTYGGNNNTPAPVTGTLNSTITTSGFISFEGVPNIPTLFGPANPTAGTQTAIQQDIIAYFDQYATVNGSVISDSLNGTYFDTIAYDPVNLTPAQKWQKILQLYANNLHMLTQFITTSDVIVCTGTCALDGSNIISMNGTHGKPGDFAIIEKEYEYIDSTGVKRTGTKKVYTFQGNVISSNIFGNGIVDFTTLYNTATATTNSVFKYNVFQTKMKTSSVMGDGFKKDAISNFLSKIKTEVGSVFVGEGETIDMSLNANITSTSSRSREKMNVAFKSILKPESKSTGGRFNLGSLGITMAVSGNEASTRGVSTKEAEKNKILQGFVGGVERFGDYFITEAKPLAFNPEKPFGTAQENSKVSNLGIVAPVSESITVSVLALGSSVDTLALEKLKGSNFTVLSKGLGFREGYGSFAELFSENQNIQGGAFAYNNGKVNINTIVAMGETENIFNNKIEKSSFASLEVAKDFANTKVKFVSGALAEEGKLLGSQFAGGLAIQSSTSYFAGMELEQKLFNNLFLNADYTIGSSKVDTGNASIFRDFSNIKTSAMSIGLSNKNILGGTLGFTYSQGLRINSGSATLDNGNFLGTFDISSEGKERNFEFSFNKAFKETSSVKLSLVHTEDLDNIKGERQNLLVLTASKKF